MAKAKRAFVSFDYDHDSDLKTLLVGQAKNPGSPFKIHDWSVKEHLIGDWKEKVRKKFAYIDVVVVICGEKTDKAAGVSAELLIAKEMSVPYFLLYGRATKNCVKPKSADTSDKIYKWTWENIKSLLAGNR